LHVLDLHHHVPVQGVRVGQNLGDGAHRASRNAGGQQLTSQQFASDLAQVLLKQDTQGVTVAKSARVGGETWLIGHLRASEEVAQLFPLSVVADA